MNKDVKKYLKTQRLLMEARKPETNSPKTHEENKLFNAANLMVLVISVFISITLSNFLLSPPFKTAEIKNNKGATIFEITYR